MNKILTLILFAFVVAMCNTEDTKTATALFIRICNAQGQDCTTYMPTKKTTLDTNNIDVIKFVEDNDNVFFGEESANYTFLSYLSKDTLTILIQRDE